LLRAEHNRVGEDGTIRSFGSSLGRVSQPYPREYASFEPNERLLRDAAAAAGGDFAPSAQRFFEPGDAKVVFHEGLWQRFIVLALVCFFLDLLMRRVRLFDRGFAR
jgi:hypothetical protein